MAVAGLRHLYLVLNQGKVWTSILMQDLRPSDIFVEVDGDNVKYYKANANPRPPLRPDGVWTIDCETVNV